MHRTPSTHGFAHPTPSDLPNLCATTNPASSELVLWLVSHRQFPQAVHLCQQRYERERAVLEVANLHACELWRQVCPRTFLLVSCMSCCFCGGGGDAGRRGQQRWGFWGKRAKDIIVPSFQSLLILPCLFSAPRLYECLQGQDKEAMAVWAELVLPWAPAAYWHLFLRHLERAGKLNLAVKWLPFNDRAKVCTFFAASQAFPCRMPRVVSYFVLYFICAELPFMCCSAFEPQPLPPPSSFLPFPILPTLLS